MIPFYFRCSCPVVYTSDGMCRCGVVDGPVHEHGATRSCRHLDPLLAPAPLFLNHRSRSPSQFTDKVMSIFIDKCQVAYFFPPCSSHQFACQ
jgi:hypothetical protein